MYLIWNRRLPLLFCGIRNGIGSSDFGITGSGFIPFCGLGVIGNVPGAPSPGIALSE